MTSKIVLIDPMFCTIVALSNVHKMTETFAQLADYVEHYEAHTIQLNLITPPPTSRRSRKREKLFLTLKGYLWNF